MGLKHTLAVLFVAGCAFITIGIRPVDAIVDPLAVSNNLYGIHIIDDHDLPQSKDLVNSNGGDWGYVTIVITEEDRDPVKWQRIFDQLRQLHLIPLVRLATKPINSHWQKPSLDQAGKWAEFLGSLNWVVKNRYVILFNEPNHSKEWGGEIKPHEYAEVAKQYRHALKTHSDDFFVLPAGFDTTAANTTETMEASQYFKFLNAYNQEFFSLFDGWTSHSYPNPGFSGSPLATGKSSIRGFEWERSFLGQYGLSPNIPIFITETGWVHQQGQEIQYGLYPAEKVAENYEIAYTNVWSDPNIVAITPFVMKYPQPPFDHFAWIQPDGVTPYPQYDKVKSLSKPKGDPVQIHDGYLIHPTIPDTLVTDSTYNFLTTWENTGQSIWNESEYSLILNGLLVAPQYSNYPMDSTAPFEEFKQSVRLTTPLEPGIYQLTIELHKGDRQFGEAYTRSIRVIPPPNLIIRASHWLRRGLTGDNFTLEIYQDDQVIKSFKPVSLVAGEGMIEEVRDIVPEQPYQFVLKKPAYLPSSIIAVLREDTTALDFSPMYPLDFVKDDKFDYHDLSHIITHPIISLKQLILAQPP